MWNWGNRITRDNEFAVSYRELLIFFADFVRSSLRAVVDKILQLFIGSLCQSKAG
jgi:hypothetical protein